MDTPGFFCFYELALEFSPFSLRVDLSCEETVIEALNPGAELSEDPGLRRREFRFAATRKHLNNIYGKLSISGRRQAVDKARVLGILSDR